MLGFSVFALLFEDVWEVKQNDNLYVMYKDKNRMDTFKISSSKHGFDIINKIRKKISRVYYLKPKYAFVLLLWDEQNTFKWCTLACSYNKYNQNGNIVGQVI